MHLLITDRGNEPFLAEELVRTCRCTEHRVYAPGLLACDFTLQPEAPPLLVFARQVLPESGSLQALSVRDWAQQLFHAVAELPDDRPWQLHVVPQYGSGGAGSNRCGLIRKALSEVLRQKRRHLLRRLETEPVPFTEQHSLAQLVLTSPERAFLSVSKAPIPFQLRRVMWPFPLGEVPIASDKNAPSRAFAKLLEAEERLGRRIRPGDSCVDLGASPGSWSYVALNRGACVTAVDRAPLRADLMREARLTFQQGDAFRFRPSQPVDWLLCDIIAAPARSIDLLMGWLRGRLARQFVVTIKFKGTDDYRLLEHLKYALPPLCKEHFLARLCANKNEVSAFGCCG